MSLDSIRSSIPKIQDSNTRAVLNKIVDFLEGKEEKTDPEVINPLENMGEEE